MRLQIWVVGIGILLLIIKFTAYFYTGSLAILTDAVESIVNVAAGLFAMYSLNYAAQPKDDDHPYGHGKIEFISAGMEGTLVILAGGYILVEIARSAFEPHLVTGFGVGLPLVLISGGINYGMGRLLVRKGEAEKSPTMIAGGLHLITDAYSALGLLFGLLAVYCTHIYSMDLVFAGVFAALIIYTGWGIIQKAMAGIMDKADLALAAEVIDCLDAKRQPDWIDLHNFRIIQYGSALHIDCHVTVPYYYTVAEAHEVIKDLEDVLLANTKRDLEIFIHTDPCIPRLSCTVCTKTDCLVRAAPLKDLVSWRVANVLVNEKHSL